MSKKDFYSALHHRSNPREDSPDTINIGEDTYVKSRKKCTCACHTRAGMIHIVNCCDNGYIYEYHKH